MLSFRPLLMNNINHLIETTSVTSWTCTSKELMIQKMIQNQPIVVSTENKAEIFNGHLQK